MSQWVIRSSTEDWEYVSRDIEKELVSNGFRADFAASLLLAADEIFANIAFHAYDGCEGDVIIRSRAEGRRAILSFTDRGPAFDPLTYRRPAAVNGKKESGGWGISIARAQVDEMRYAYENDSNNLTMIKTQTQSSED